MRTLTSTRTLVVLQATVAIAVLASAGGPRLALLAALAGASILNTGSRASRALAVGILTATAISVIAAGQASSQPLINARSSRAENDAHAPTAQAELQLITEPQSGNAPFLALIDGAPSRKVAEVGGSRL